MPEYISDESDTNKQLRNKYPNSYKAVSSLLTHEDLNAAENLLLEHAMILTDIALKKVHLDSLLPVRDGVLIVTQGRLVESKMSELLVVHLCQS